MNRTALYVAVLQGDEHITKELLHYGASVNEVESGIIDKETSSYQVGLLIGISVLVSTFS